jgi:hypothetical protein
MEKITQKALISAEVGKKTPGKENGRWNKEYIVTTEFLRQVENC